MKKKIVFSLGIILCIFLVIIIFDNLSQETPEIVNKPIAAVNVPDMMELADSTDSESKETETSLNLSEEQDQPSSAVLSSGEPEDNAMKARVSREDAARQHKSYNRLRKEWRKELRAARIEARESGDYTYFNDLKSNPPDKMDMTLD